MAENLGEAQLVITVNSQQALQQLAAFRTQVTQALGAVGTIRFEGIEQPARAAGQRAGRAVADGVRQATQGLRFGNLQEALDFSGALNGTLRDLRQYRDAVVALRDTTAATAPEFATLNDVVVACDAAIRNFSTGSDALADALDRVQAREAADRLRAYQQGVRQAAAADREWEGAIRTIVGAQRDAARASREVTAANREQLKSFLDLTKGAASATSKGIGAAAKGVGGAVKGAVNLGKGAYELGAEFGVFEAPRTGPIKEAINQVIERFKFLGEQATTTRGMVLRSIEAIGASGVLSGVAANADTLRAALNGLSVTSRTAEGALSWLANFGQGFANLTAKIPIVGDLAQLAANGEKAVAVTSTLGDFLTQLGVSAGGVALNSIEALVNAVSSIPPEAQAAVLALGGLSLAFKDKPIIAGLTRVTEYLEGLKSQTLSVSQGLQSMLEFASRIETPALPEYRERGLQRLDMQFANAGGSAPGAEAVARITDEISGNVKEVKTESDAVDAAWERGTRYLQKSNQEMRRLVEQGLELKQLGIGPSGFIPKQTNQLPPGAPATSLPNPNQYSAPVEPSAIEVQRAQLEEDLAQIQAQRVQQQERADLLHEQALQRQKKLQEEQTAAVERAARAADSALKGTQRSRLAEVGAGIKPEPRRSTNRILKDVTGSALIGGAFPLLFGQGLGASVGGGVGGAAGGLLGGQFGFGLSLVGTAIGTQVDETVKKLSLLGGALKDPIGKFGELAEAGLFSSTAMQKNVESLIASGREAEAAAQIQLDLAKTYGNQEDLLKLNTALEDLKGSFSRLGVVMLNFIAGPMADFINKLAKSTGLIAERASFDQRISDLGLNEDQRKGIIVQAREQAKAAGDLSQIYKFAGDIVDKTYGKTKEVIAAETKLEQAKQRQIELDKISSDLIVAQAEGRKREVLELQRRELILQREQALSAAPAQQQDSITRKFEKDLQRVNAELAALPVKGSLGYAAEQAERLNFALDRTVIGTSEYNNLLQQQINTQTQLQNARKTDTQRWAEEIAAANQLKSIEEETAIQRERGRLTSTGIGALQSLKGLRDAQRAEQEAQAKLRTDPYNTGLSDAANQAAEAVKLAAAKTKADLQEAFKAAEESVRSISRSIEDAITALNAARGGAEGVNKYIEPQQRQDRQQAANTALFSEAVRLAKQLGVDATFRGNLTERNSQITEFINAARQELRGTEDINVSYDNLAKATNDLNDINKGLIKVNDALATATKNLAEKDWNVYVNVPGAGQYTYEPRAGVYN